jgi:hypothetical protein
MAHSALAVLAGFAVMAVVVMIATALALHFVLGVPLAAMRSAGPQMLSPSYLVTNVAASALAATVGGYTTAAIAEHDQIGHGLALAAVMVLMSLVSMRRVDAAQPRWYRVVLATVMPALAIGGAVLGGWLTPFP